MTSYVFSEILHRDETATLLQNTLLSEMAKIHNYRKQHRADTRRCQRMSQSVIYEVFAWHAVQSSEHLFHVFCTHWGCIWWLPARNRLLVPSAQEENQVAATDFAWASERVCWFVYLNVRACSRGHTRAGFRARVSAEWQVETLRGTVMDTSSYLWFKERLGSEAGGSLLWGKYKGGFLLCTFCVPVFVLSNHLFLYGNVSLPQEFAQRHHLLHKDQRSPTTSYSWLLAIPLMGPAIIY